MLKAPDARDQRFYDYWQKVIDWTDPAAPTWMAHFDQRVRECSKIADEIAQYKPLSGQRVLDIGCQTGALSCVLAERGAHVTGVEPEAWVLRAAEERAAGWKVPLTLQTAVGEALPFERHSFDVVCFVDVVEHCRDAHACVREIARVLAPGGVAYIYGPNRLSPQWLWSDPHYALFGASVLPPALGRRYVEWRRDKVGYDVGVFPIANVLQKWLQHEGMVVEHSLYSVAQERAIKLGASPLAAKIWASIRFATVPLFTIVARKVRP
jgi:SAM-dependent methyltransferase